MSVETRAEIHLDRFPQWGYATSVITRPQAPASPEQCAHILTRAVAALAVVMVAPAGIRLGNHTRHELPAGLSAELLAHGAAIGKLLRAGRLPDNYCPDCAGPLSFEWAAQPGYCRAICPTAYAGGCGFMRIFWL